MLAEIFAHASFDAIARHGTAGRTHSYRETESRVLETVHFAVTRNSASRGAQSGAVHGVELRLVGQPRARGRPRAGS